ncbi:helix-turn-helix domain-containing protein [Nocardia sp. NBC_01009]|uniref:helix-turn-helix domain-containing protein n=1 Tax=Nocardia sp. NBC_01009 TaxID=2975996 RepID=UPI003867503B|nr:helix-turn-helix domain-containing protein [Nocardia sp. NBC_01009]
MDTSAADPTPGVDDEDAVDESADDALEHEYDIALGDVIRTERVIRKLSRLALASQVGMNAKTLQRIEGAEKPATMKQLYRIARAFGVTPGALTSAADQKVGIE